MTRLTIPALVAGLVGGLAATAAAAPFDGAIAPVTVAMPVSVAAGGGWTTVGTPDATYGPESTMPPTARPAHPTADSPYLLDRRRPLPRPPGLTPRTAPPRRPAPVVGHVRRERPTPGPVETDPLDVAAHVDQARAVTKRISASGGTISTTATDGTMLTLTLPSNALLTGENITIAPVTGIEGLPFSGGLTGAVQLEPEGLRLLQPAVLEIKPAAGAPSAQALTMFAWTGAGKDFHLYPPRREADPTAQQKLTMNLWHFSGYGAGGSTAQERDAQSQRRPDGGEAANEQEMAGPLRDERECQLAGTSCRSPQELEQELIDTARATYNDSVRPALDAALTDDALIESAVGAALAWMRQLVLLGLAEELAGEMTAVEAAIGSILVAAYDRAAARCATDPAAVGRMLTLMRTGTLLGIGDRFDQSKLQRCLQFEMNLETRLRAQDWRQPEVFRTMHVRANGLRYDGLLDNGDPAEDAWVPLEFVSGERVDNHAGFAKSRLTANLGCEVALDDVQVKHGNLRAGGDPVTEVTAVLRMRGPVHCEQWTYEQYGTNAINRHLRDAWSYQFNNLRPVEPWVPGYNYWHGSGGEYTTPDGFDARYNVLGLRGSGGTWTLTFDKIFRPTTNLQSTSEWEPHRDYTEQTTVTLRHAAAG